MAKQVILAVAGAGKTYHVCHELHPDKKTLFWRTHMRISTILSAN